MEKPKGKIVAIGGNEDKGTTPEPVDEDQRQQVRFFENGILKRIHDELHGRGTRIEVVTTASHIPEELGQAYLEAFLLLGCDNVGILPLKTRQDADKPEFLERLKKTDAVMFTGGNQSLLTQVLAGTAALEIIKKRYQTEEKFLISGTSAGAMALCQIMIKGSEESKPLIKGMVSLGNGLGLLPEIIIDTHFVNRRRMPRLIETMAANPQCLGIGLGEDTGILISDGNCIETIGSGLVVVLDARHLLENNYPQAQPGELLCLEKMIMHVLPRGRSFLVKSGEMV